MSVDGASGDTVELGDRRLTLPHQLDHQSDTRQSTINNDVVVQKSSTPPPPPRDVTDDYVTNDVSGKMVYDWLQQLVDVSTMLSRFITLEYFSDGAALTKALSFG